jgi:hypothetical protein
MKIGDIVWHTNFKCKVELMAILPKCWFSVRLLKSGGYMDTQLIEPYKNQDK